MDPYERREAETVLLRIADEIAMYATTMVEHHLNPHKAAPSKGAMHHNAYENAKKIWAAWLAENLPPEDNWRARVQALRAAAGETNASEGG